MKFSSYLNPDYIFPCLEVNSKEEIIRTIVDKVAEDNKMVSEQKNKIIKNILKREEQLPLLKINWKLRLVEQIKLMI